MRRVTVTKVIDKHGVMFKARKPTKAFHEGDLVKFIFPDNEIISIVRTGSMNDSACDACIWVGGSLCKAPTIGNHRLCGFISSLYGRFERLDNVLEEL